jgi:hypothetical protein
MWYADKAAFRVGYVSNNVWDKDSIGKYSNAFGSNTKAIGQGSFAAGNSTVASGFYSAALNVLSTASSYSETAIGQFNTLDPAASPDIWTLNDRLFVVGNGTSGSVRSDAFTVLKNGTVKIGNKGTFLTNLQEGLINAGTLSGNNKKTVTLNFTNAFDNASNVRVQLTPRTANGITDVFVLGVRNITNTQCTVDIFRADAAAGTGWGSAFDIQWMAWE